MRDFFAPQANHFSDVVLTESLNSNTSYYFWFELAGTNAQLTRRFILKLLLLILMNMVLAIIAAHIVHNSRFLLQI